jgi:hypothetical protein
MSSYIPLSIKMILAGMLPVFAIAACGGSQSNVPEDTGTATMAITQVPPNVRCLRIVVAGSRVATRLFAVTPGQSSVLSLGRLPLGTDTFVGDAFPFDCSGIGGSVPTWTSDPVTAVVVVDPPVAVSLLLRPNGRGSVSVGFEDDAGASPEGGSGLPNTIQCDSSGCICVAGFADCDGTLANGCETNIASDVNNCGACGASCPVNVTCVSGSCGLCGSAPTSTTFTGFETCGQSFNETRAIEVTVPAPDRAIQSVSVRGLLLPAGGGLIGARIYESASQLLVASSSTNVAAATSMVTLPMQVTLTAGKSYRIGIFVQSNPPQQASGCILGGPVLDDTFTVTGVFESPDDSFPNNVNLDAPEIAIDSCAR